MRPFPGFPEKTSYTPLPHPFLTALLPEMDDLAELKVCLHLFRLLYQKRGYPRFVTLAELLKDRSLTESIGDDIAQALERVCQRGVFLPLTLEREGRKHHLYFLNTPKDREALARIERGEIPLGEISTEEVPPPPAEQRDIFTLYQENIGLLTPLIAEQLREAEQRYPASWIEDAFRQALGQNKRRWSYIARILERWAEEGKEGGKTGGHLRPATQRPPAGKYGRTGRR